MKARHFRDWWHIEHQDHARIARGRPVWHSEATDEDPTFDYRGFWPRVRQDEAFGGWRMLYDAIRARSLVVPAGFAGYPVMYE